MTVTEFSAVLNDKTALVIGCGGLGCHVIEHLLRLNIHRIFAVDFDNFSPSNLNRQLYCTNDTLGRNKAEVAKERAKKVCPSIEFISCPTKFTDENAENFFKNSDIIFDCCDNVETRLLLEKTAENEGKILVHGAINGLLGQVAVIRPSEKTLSKLYKNGSVKTGSTLSFTPAVTAALQVSEGCKALLNMPCADNGQIIIFDMNSTMPFSTLSLN